MVVYDKIVFMPVSDEDIQFMRLALAEAARAYDEGEVPVGAILVMDNAIVASARNRRETDHDPTGHAEIVAIKAGAEKTGEWRLTGATLYVTKEPCIMCAGAIVNARLGRVVYGCKDSKGGGVDSLYNILSDKRLNHRVEVVSGVLSDECADILKKFFQERR